MNDMRSSSKIFVSRLRGCGEGDQLAADRRDDRIEILHLRLFLLLESCDGPVESYYML